ncbi:copper resistance protein CopC [Pontimonas sp.]|uniref:copper resistance CopC family protein n=1 Tax=Pontimonas sp. TaxID=2304492 RepID=UPI0028704962|nr:copper resistance protein CopC [Pontimonas sp.]MDR9395968.1 copper resistance protein CopC [Pontimonas sp.]
MTSPRKYLALPLGVVALVGAWMVASSAALAHDQVIETTPAAGETVSEHPLDITITTSGELLDLGGNSAGFALLVTDQAGLFYGDGCTTIDGMSLSTSVDMGDSGPYTVTYQYVSGDGHTLSGEYDFTFERPEDYLPAAGQAEAPVCGEPPVYPLESTTQEGDRGDAPAEGDEQPPAVEQSPDLPAEAEQPGLGRVATAASIIIPLAIGAGLVYWFARRDFRR